MFAAVRRYSGLDRSVVDEMAMHAVAIRAALNATPGSCGCDVISTREGLIVIALGDDEGSVIEAGRRFVAWIDCYLPALRSASPEVWAGAVIVHGFRERSKYEGGME